MTAPPLKTPKMLIYGEGVVSPLFLGSVYMKVEGETEDKAGWRFSEAMLSMGLEWLGEQKQK